jgi:hypothetical protein
VKLSSRRNGMRVAHALMLREINEAGTVQERASPRPTAKPPQRRRARHDQPELHAE